MNAYTSSAHASISNIHHGIAKYVCILKKVCVKKCRIHHSREHCYLFNVEVDFDLLPSTTVRSLTMFSILINVLGLSSDMILWLAQFPKSSPRSEIEEQMIRTTHQHLCQIKRLRNSL